MTISRLGVLRVDERSDSDNPSQARTPATDAEFKSIYDSHFNLIWRALKRYGIPDSDMMDLTQKVFLTAFLKLPEFEGRSRISTWLWGIARRVASSHRQSSMVQNEVPTDIEELDLAVEDEVTAESPRQSAVERILAKIPEPQRVVFLLFEVEEMEGLEIAALLDIPLGTVRSRLRYAREVFRRETERLAAQGASSTRTKR
ncbi:MAG TPA: sigma-70 family RNA polymerase sigma factor [Polyangiaceae bacterium]|nr:sigma-70 family RNA polymerase sigma factor [Polyangiaceae bacterium]